METDEEVEREREKGEEMEKEMLLHFGSPLFLHRFFPFSLCVVVV